MDSHDDDLRCFEAVGTPPLPVSPNAGYVETNGARIWYAAYGAGPPVVLLHGALGSSELWSRLVAALVAAGYRAITIDTRGHGRSTLAERPLTYSLFAHDAVAVLDALKIAQAAFVGWSDGAIVALTLAMSQPARVAGIFAFGGNADPSGVKPLDRHDPLIGRAFRRQLQTYARVAPVPSHFAALREAIDTLMRTEPQYTAADLARIGVPVTIAYGEYDEFIRREHAADIANAIVGADFVVLADVGHFAPLQRPAEFTSAVLRFLEHQHASDRRN